MREYDSFEVERIHNIELNRLNNCNAIKAEIATIHNSLGLGARTYFPDGNGIWSMDQWYWIGSQSYLTSNGLCWMANVSGKLRMCDGSSEKEIRSFNQQ